MDIVRQGEGSGVEKEVMGNMQHQLQLLSQVICYGSTSCYITELNYCVFKRTSQNAQAADTCTTFPTCKFCCMGTNLLQTQQVFAGLDNLSQSNTYL